MEQRNVTPLRLKAIEIYGTIGGFAKAMKWSPRKASYITTGKQDLTAKEIEDCAEALRVENAADFMRIFYPYLSIKWTDEKGAEQ